VDVNNTQVVSPTLSAEICLKYLEEAVGVEKELGARLEESHDTDGIWLTGQSLAVMLQYCHRDAEKHLWSLHQKAVPNSQQSLPNIS